MRGSIPEIEGGVGGALYLAHDAACGARCETTARPSAPAAGPVVANRGRRVCRPGALPADVEADGLASARSPAPNRAGQPTSALPAASPVQRSHQQSGRRGPGRIAAAPTTRSGRRQEAPRGAASQEESPPTWLWAKTKSRRPWRETAGRKRGRENRYDAIGFPKRQWLKRLRSARTVGASNQNVETYSVETFLRLKRSTRGDTA